MANNRNPKKLFPLLAAIALSLLAASAAAQTGWAHQAAGFQSNGAVTVKSTTGGTYSSTLNPTGAIAKLDQNASTQPPTVIIQATSAGYSETIPLVNNTLTPPMCPATYTRVWTKSGTGCTTELSAGYHNVAGTKWTLIYVWKNNQYVGWIPDNGFDRNETNVIASHMPQVTVMCHYSTERTWSASLCQK